MWEPILGAALQASDEQSGDHNVLNYIESLRLVRAIEDPISKANSRNRIIYKFCFQIYQKSIQIMTQGIRLENKE